MNKLNVIVVFGGVSSEHPISCISAASILRNIDKENIRFIRSASPATVLGV